MSVPHFRCLFAVLVLAALAGASSGEADTPVFSEALAPGWTNWSWSTVVSFSNASPAHSGAASMAVTYQDGWAGLYLHVEPTIDGTPLQTLSFWVHGGTVGGQRFRVLIYRTTTDATRGYDLTVAAGSWQHVAIPLTSFGSPATITGIVWQDTTGAVQPAFFLDDVSLLAATGTPTPTPPPGSGPTLLIDTGAGYHAISPGSLRDELRR